MDAVMMQRIAMLVMLMACNLLASHSFAASEMRKDQVVQNGGGDSPPVDDGYSVPGVLVLKDGAIPDQLNIPMFCNFRNNNRGTLCIRGKISPDHPGMILLESARTQRREVQEGQIATQDWRLFGRLEGPLGEDDDELDTVAVNQFKAVKISDLSCGIMSLEAMVNVTDNDGKGNEFPSVDTSGAILIYHQCAAVSGETQASP